MLISAFYHPWISCQIERTNSFKAMEEYLWLAIFVWMEATHLFVDATFNAIGGVALVEVRFL
jgi:hypothetical protein